MLEDALRLEAGLPAGRFTAALPSGAAGNWCHLAVSMAPQADAAWWVKLEAADAARGQVVREAFLGRQYRSRGRVWRATLVHLPQAADSLALHVFTPSLAAEPRAVLRVLGRRRAAVALLARGWPVLPRALAGEPRGLLGRVRAMLGQHPARTGEAPPYSLWIALYDDWRAVRASCQAPGGPPVDVAVVGEDDAGRAATLASLRAQWMTPGQTHLVARPTDCRAADGAWVLVMQAGEQLAPHGLACFAAAARRYPDATGFYADVDSITVEGRRDPLFKPDADPWLARSGLLTHGACLFRPGLLPGAAQDAAAWRQAVAAAPESRLRHVPFVLTHVPAGQGAEAANAAIAHRTARPSVSLVIPTSARQHHMLPCLRAVLAHTDYPDFEILLAVSHVDPGDRRQAANLAAAAALPSVRVLDLKMPAFNYAAVNNLAVQQARGELVLLLNDDVVPSQRDWLQRMTDFVAGASPMRADIVGARLLYGNGLVQHGGVTLGLANLCEHSFRLFRRDDPGPYNLALLNRQVSAVTAACMLVRRSLFTTIGGMDEAFAVALNDVDFCLRAGQAGARIVLAAEVTLVHYESLSLGRHYQGDRAQLEALEVRRLRERWAATIEDDPYYSLSASLEPGREFQPGFPPRITPASWWRSISSASG